MEVASGAVRFDAFEIDLRTEELRKHGLKLRLPRQSFEILVVLVQRPGELVSREELRERLWPADTFVDFDHGLNAAMNRLREVLGDSSEKPRFIETLPRRGYRFIAPVSASAEHPRLSATSVRPSVTAAAETSAAVEQEREDKPAKATPISYIGSKQVAPPYGMRWKALLIAVVLLIAIVTIWWLIHFKPAEHAIAVLPFKNLSTEPNSDYFSDGLTDEIIRDLSLVEGLQVKSRTSSFLFKDKPRDVRDIGKQLGADLLLEGSVLRAGDQLRINVDLVRVADDSTLWSQRFDREQKDVFSVQDEISRSIVNQLRLKHVGGQRRYDTNLEAYDLYLRAQSLGNPVGSDKRPDAIALYQQVIAKAPDFAPAYAGLADVYAAAADRPDEQMREMAEKAIQLDPLLAEAYGALGLVYEGQLAWGDAEQSFQHALQLNPNLARVRERYGMFVLQPQGKIKEAIQQFREAVALDPLSRSPRLALALGLIDAGAYDEALDTCRRAVADTQSADEDFNWHFARALWFSGARKEAIDAFEHLPPGSRSFLSYMYARLGRRSEAEQLDLGHRHNPLRYEALFYAGLGDRDRVMDTFEKMAAAHDHIVDIYPLFPEFALMRDAPRMKEFRRKRNLPWPP